jgi:hypothetical protein
VPSYQVPLRQVPLRQVLLRERGSLRFEPRPPALCGGDFGLAGGPRDVVSGAKFPPGPTAHNPLRLANLVEGLLGVNGPEGRIRVFFHKVIIET